MQQEKVILVTLPKEENNNESITAILRTELPSTAVGAGKQSENGLDVYVLGTDSQKVKNRIASMGLLRKRDGSIGYFERFV